MRARNASGQAWVTGGVRWRWLPGLFALLLALYLSHAGLLEPLERLVYNQTLLHFAPEAHSGNVIVVTLPEPQWSPGQLTELLTITSQAQAVGLLLPLTQPDNTLAHALIRRHLESLPATAVQYNLEPYPTLQRLQQDLVMDPRLAATIRSSSNLILAATYQPTRSDAVALHSAHFGLVAAKTIPVIDSLPGPLSPAFPQATSPQWPLEGWQDTGTALIGLVGDAPAEAQPALVEHRGEGHPSMLLQLLRLNSAQPATAQIAFLPHGGIDLGSRHYPSDRSYRFYPYAALNGALPEGIPTYPITQLLNGQFNARDFKGKTLLIGHHSGASTLATMAVALDALLQQRVVVIHEWATWGQHGALLAVALLLMFLLPRLQFSTASLTVLLASLLLLNGEFLLLMLNRQWLPLSLPLITLLLGYLLISLRNFLGRHEARLAFELTESNRQLGRMLQNQGDLDEALEKYRRCRMDGELLEQLYHLGLDFERKRQFSKAVSVFQQIHAHIRGFRDVAERIERNQQMAQRIVLANSGPTTPSGTVIMSTEGLQAPTLGHYQVEREIGRGAMGMVYLAKDPRIGRQVAIKTMALAAEFEGSQLQEVKERFYREAETAGRLNHPNIVHIYDIGEEQELAYIAMDYLHGEHLGHFTKAKSLLPIKEVLTIAQQVAEALAYAHKKNVVHRDIKPANIIYDRPEGKARVTDFGVACMTDSSKTKTGTVLGSPSYMSPEQVAGMKVDGRADIFSLGVTLYQLITGHLPFEADSLGSLMYKIANEAHPKPGKFRKGIPACVTRIINKCLQKDPANRYADSAELAATLRRCQGK